MQSLILQLICKHRITGTVVLETPICVKASRADSEICMNTVLVMRVRAEINDEMCEYVELKSSFVRVRAEINDEICEYAELKTGFV